jgi:hypothetical protein
VQVKITSYLSSASTGEKISEELAAVLDFESIHVTTWASCPRPDGDLGSPRHERLSPTDPKHCTPCVWLSTYCCT